MAKVAREARVARKARGLGWLEELIILWFSWLYGLIKKCIQEEEEILKDLY